MSKTVPTYKYLREVIQYLIEHKWEVLLSIALLLIVIAVVMFLFLYLADKFGFLEKLSFRQSKDSTTLKRLQDMINNYEEIAKERNKLKSEDVLEVCLEMREARQKFATQVQEEIYQSSLSLEKLFKQNDIVQEENMYYILCKEIMPWWHRTSENLIKERGQMAHLVSVQDITNAKVKDLKLKLIDLWNIPSKMHLSLDGILYSLISALVGFQVEYAGEIKEKEIQIKSLFGGKDV